MFKPHIMDLQTSSERNYLHQNVRGHNRSPSDAYDNVNGTKSEVAKIPMSLTIEDYPAQFSQSNPFCALCGKYIQKTESFATFNSVQRKKKYLIHAECSENSEGKTLSVSQASQAKLQSIAFLNHIRSIALGGKQFYIELEVLHPLGGYSFAKLWTKLKSIGNVISWDLRSLNQADCFSPNIVAFPLPDFQIVVNLIEIGQRQGKQTRKALISVGKLGGKQVQFVKAYTEHIELTLQIIGSKEDQLRTIDEMNLKYRFPLETGTPLVQLVRLQIKLPAEESDDDDEQSRRNSSIMELTSEKTSHREDKSVHNSQALSQRSFDREKIDLQKLIDSEKLGEYVRQNTQSRVFQNWLSEASPREIDEVISALWKELPELITHEYANYMVQKLISVCNLAQRVRLIQRLQGDIPGIARNKQGTHSLQTFITLFTTHEEYKLICASIKINYLSLAQHPNATHFLQKIITLFPISFTVEFMQMVLQDFLSYALDKHAMCVIKQMLKKISELQQNSKQSQIVNEIKKQFLHIVNFNIDQLICDQYGNYVIQFCYEYFKEDKCGAIAERIIDKFYQFSLQKFSSAVLLKCINFCWTKKETLDRLRNALTHEIINEMFRNKEANKVLLEIVQRFEDSALREKIQSQLMLSQPTKFNHDRWGVALGSRSGMVGGEWGNFTEAVKKNNNNAKKNKKSNNMR